MIHYHGTPITPRACLAQMAGRHFCISWAAPNDLMWCLDHGASVMLDNGAFSAWTRKQVINWPAFYEWVAPHLRHPHWAVIPDVIDGDEMANDALLASCPLPRALSAPVWHMHESLERLSRLSSLYTRICIGSSGEYATIGNLEWRNRINDAWQVIQDTDANPWVHMLRAMKEASEGDWPFASADSTNVARNHAGSINRAAQDTERMAARIDARNPRHIGRRKDQGNLFT